PPRRRQPHRRPRRLATGPDHPRRPRPPRRRHRPRQTPRPPPGHARGPEWVGVLTLAATATHSSFRPSSGRLLLFPRIRHRLELRDVGKVPALTCQITGGTGLIGPLLYLGDAVLMLGDQRVT